MLAQHPAYNPKPINGKIVQFEEYYQLASKGKGYPATLKQVVKVYEPVLVPAPQIKPLLPPKGFKRGLVELSNAALALALEHYGVKAPSMTTQAIIDHVHSNSGNVVAIWDSAKGGKACLKIRLEQSQPYDVPVVRFYRINVR